MNELQGKLYYKQKGKCTICNNPLLNKNNINIAEGQYLKDENKIIIQDSYIHNINEKQGPNLKEQQFDQLKNDYTREKKWYTNLHIDHKIPETFGKISSFKAIIGDIENKQLVHKQCHKIKTTEDLQIIKLFINSLSRQLRVIKKNISKCNSQELFNINKNSIKEILTNKDIQKYFDKYQTTLVIKRLLAVKILKKISIENYNNTKLIKRPPSHRLANIKKIQDRKSQQRR